METNYDDLMWENFLRELDQKELKKQLRRSFYGIGMKARAIAVRSLRATGIRPKGDSSDWEKGIRVISYPDGIKITVQPGNIGNIKGTRRRLTSMHVNRYGIKKPVLQWIEDGTKDRKSSSGWTWKHFESRIGHKKGRQYLIPAHQRKVKVYSVKRGAMPAKPFLQPAEPKMLKVVEQHIEAEITRALERAAKKCGFV